MKLQLFFITTLLFVVACKDQKNESTAVQEEKELTIAEKIAKAHGHDNWQNVDEIQFTFNVDRGENHFERSWSWKPKTDDVTMITSTDTVSYNRKSMDSLSTKADRSFINDKYWLLAPFNLVWDEGTTITTQDSVTAPISESTLNKLTLLYNTEGGYTPGDAYDFFYDTNYEVKEWVFRRGNQEDPSIITTWQDYEDFNGLKIAKTHLNKEKSSNLYFTNIKVE